MPQLSGDIELMPLTDVVAWLGNHKRSVTLTVKARQTTTDFLIRDGGLVQSSSSDPREYLGQHLINFGYIDEEQLTRAFETQQETAVPLGRVLVMVSALTAERLGGSQSTSQRVPALGKTRCISVHMRWRAMASLWTSRMLRGSSRSRSVSWGISEFT